MRQLTHTHTYTNTQKENKLETTKRQQISAMVDNSMRPVVTTFLLYLYSPDKIYCHFKTILVIKSSIAKISHSFFSTSSKNFTKIQP